MKISKFLPLVIVVALAACGEKEAATEPDAAATSPPASASAPAAAPSVAAPAPAAAGATTTPAAPVASAGDLVKGEQIYTANCLACHGAAVMGAPKFADKTAWQPRIAKGIDVLYTNSINGFKMMPPKGLCNDCTDAEFKALIKFMSK